MASANENAVECEKVIDLLYDEKRINCSFNKIFGVDCSKFVSLSEEDREEIASRGKENLPVGWNSVRVEMAVENLGIWNDVMSLKRGEIDAASLYDRLQCDFNEIDRDENPVLEKSNQMDELNMWHNINLWMKTTNIKATDPVIEHLFEVKQKNPNIVQLREADVSGGYFVFHSTLFALLPGILAEGLQPKAGSPVYFTDHFSYATYFGQKDHKHEYVTLIYTVKRDGSGEKVEFDPGSQRTKKHFRLKNGVKIPNDRQIRKKYNFEGKKRQSSEFRVKDLSCMRLSYVVVYGFEMGKGVASIVRHLEQSRR